MESQKQMERTACQEEAGFIGYNTPTGKYFTEYEGFGNSDTE